ncbi:MAG TPA: isoprenylcysteine carboxylmethyltransferase family protein [Anaerolineae bacterium]|nr:isoprenylcysteine carboxylmethyltransferase family protein [Anaerolineae bacterium]HIQ05086.1 isoprenylcysteine carboxylmethyltransferase family protein [Anaerolineae bacterium]
MLAGTDTFLSKVPALQRPRRRVLALLIALGCLLLPLGFFYLVDGWFPGAPLVTQMVVVVIGFWLVFRFFSQREAHLARYGSNAYGYAFVRYVTTGLPFIFAAIAHLVFVPGPRLVPLTWAAIPAAYLLLTGVILWLRAVFTFGLDNLFMVYVYFPDEGRLVSSSIYNVIRHPVYSGVLRIGLGLALCQGNGWALLMGLLLPVGLLVWIRFVEEPELIQRFGSGYADYRKRVPALIGWPRYWPAFWRFLIAGK